MILDNIKNSWKQNIFFMHRLRSDLLSVSELTTINKDTLLELKKKKAQRFWFLKRWLERIWRKISFNSFLPTTFSVLACNSQTYSKHTK